MIKSSIIFLMLIATFACNDSHSKTSLFNVKWELTTLEGDTLNLTHEDNRIFVKFDSIEKRVNGKATCNRFFGNYELDGSKLKFSTLGATRMACPDQQIEIKFFKLMEQVNTFSIEKGELIFKNGDDILMVFKQTQLPDSKKKE